MRNLLKPILFDLVLGLVLGGAGRGLVQRAAISIAILVGMVALGAWTFANYVIEPEYGTTGASAAPAARDVASEYRSVLEGR